MQSPLKLWVRAPLMRGVLDTTLCDKGCQWFAAGRFSPGTPVSSTNKTDRHDITELLLKVVLNTINQTTMKYNNRRNSSHDLIWRWITIIVNPTQVMTGVVVYCNLIFNNYVERLRLWCIGSYKSNYHTITTPLEYKFELVRKLNRSVDRKKGDYPV